MFPLGEMRKRDVRAVAQREGIPTYAKKDSTGICFVGERPFRDFLARYLPRTPGPIVTPEGDVVGEHQGLAYYTLGQRQGLRIGGVRHASDAPWFVAGKDMRRKRDRGGAGARSSAALPARRRGDRHALDRGA
jgi:tRNA-specific 2-thiouridylase